MTATAPSWAALLGQWQADPPLDAALLASALSYAAGAVRLGRRWPARRTISFAAGLAAAAVALQSGLDAFDERLLSAHALEHMVLMMVAAPLLLGGRPLLLALRSLPPRRRRAAVGMIAPLHRLSRPWTSVAIYATVLLAGHLGVVYAATLRDPLLHALDHLALLGAGLLLWTPLLDGDPVPSHRLQPLGRVLYLLAAMLPMALLGAYLNRAATVVYPAYAAPARALGISAVSDQQRAGAIMLVGGITIMALLGLAAALSAMLAEERVLRSREARAARTAAGEDAIPGSVA